MLLGLVFNLCNGNHPFNVWSVQILLGITTVSCASDPRHLHISVSIYRTAWYTAALSEEMTSSDLIAYRHRARILYYQSASPGTLHSSSCHFLSNLQHPPDLNADKAWLCSSHSRSQSQSPAKQSWSIIKHHDLPHVMRHYDVDQ